MCNILKITSEECGFGNMWKCGGIKPIEFQSRNMYMKVEY